MKVNYHDMFHQGSHFRKVKQRLHSNSVDLTILAIHLMVFGQVFYVSKP